MHNSARLISAGVGVAMLACGVGVRPCSAGPMFAPGHEFAGALEERVLKGLAANFESVHSSVATTRYLSTPPEGRLQELERMARGYRPDMKWEPPILDKEFRHWRQGSRERLETDAIREDGTRRPSQVLMIDGAEVGTIQMGNTDESNMYYGRLADAEDVPYCLNWWGRWDQPFRPLSGQLPDEILAEGGTVALKQEETVVIEGRECYVLEWQGERGRSLMYVDPARRFVPIRVEQYKPAGYLFCEGEAEAVMDVAGTVVPQRWHEVFTRDGQFDNDLVMEILEAEFNVPIDDRTLSIHFPTDLPVIDDRKNRPGGIWYQNGRSRKEREAHRLAGKPAAGLDVASWVHGDATTLESLQGQVVVLALWDSAHESAAEVAALLNRLDAEADVAVVAVHAAAEDGAAVKAWATETGITFPIAVDRPGSGSYPGATFEQYKVKQSPAVFVIDAEGVVRFQDIPLAAVEQAVATLSKK